MQRTSDVSNWKEGGGTAGAAIASNLHPLQLDELLIALDYPDADLSLLDGVSIQTSERCNALHVIDHCGQVRKL